MTEREEIRQEEVLVEQEGGPLRNAPWWLVSAGLHAVIMLAATLVAMERLYAVDPGDMTVLVHSPPATPLITEIPHTPDAPPGAPVKDDVNDNIKNETIIWDPT